MPPEEKKPETTQKQDYKQPKSLRTYQGDVDEVIGKNKISTTTILVAEQERKERERQNIPVPKDNTARNKFFIILGSGLLLLGVITVNTVYYVKSRMETALIQQTKTLMVFSKELDLSIASSTRSELIRRMVLEKQSFKLPLNSVLYINTVNVTGQMASTTDMLSLLGPRMPGALSRSFDNKYMLGVYSYDTNEVFIILTTSDFTQSFPGMLSWEKDMSSDLGGLFGLNQNASSTQNRFVDLALRNKDIRVLKDSDNKTLFLYSFIDKNTLLITKNENIFNAIIAKYYVDRQSK